MSRLRIATVVVLTALLGSGHAVRAADNAAPAGALSASDVEKIVHDYLLREPEVIYQAIQELQKRQQTAETARQQAMIAQHGDAIFRSADDPVAGNVDGNVTLSTGEVIPSDLIVWTAGVMANPTVVRGSDLPVEERGRIRTRPDLRVGTAEEFVPGAWAAGDISAVPDLTGKGVGGYCVPNAQHAVRQAKLLAKNIAGDLRGEAPREYIHHNLGAVAGLGLYTGVFQSGKIALKGFIAWCAHRGYHGLAMPSWERKWRVLWGWWNNFWLGRDLVNLQSVQNPRYVFEEFAARPRPAVTEAPAAPAPAPAAAASSPAAAKAEAAS